VGYCEAIGTLCPLLGEESRSRQLVAHQLEDVRPRPVRNDADGAAGRWAFVPAAYTACSSSQTSPRVRRVSTARAYGTYCDRASAM